MKLLAIDPSSRDLGWAVFDGEDLVAWGDISTAKVDYECRYMFIIGELFKLWEKYQLEEIACEQAIRFKGRHVAALEVSVISIRKWAERRKLPLSLYYPPEWKKSVVGDGHTDKSAVAQVVHLHFKDLPKVSEHIIDAIAIGLHHQGIKRIETMSK